MLRAPFPGCLQAANEQTLANPLLSENYDIMITSILYTLVVALAQAKVSRIKRLSTSLPSDANIPRKNGKLQRRTPETRQKADRPGSNLDKRPQSCWQLLEIRCFRSKRVARADQPVHFLDTIQTV